MNYKWILYYTCMYYKLVNGIILKLKFFDDYLPLQPKYLTFTQTIKSSSLFWMQTQVVFKCTFSKKDSI